MLDVSPSSPGRAAPGPCGCRPPAARGHAHRPVRVRLRLPPAAVVLCSVASVAPCFIPAPKCSFSAAVLLWGSVRLRGRLAPAEGSGGPALLLSLGSTPQSPSVPFPPAGSTQEQRLTRGHWHLWDAPFLPGRAALVWPRVQGPRLPGRVHPRCPSEAPGEERAQACPWVWDTDVGTKMAVGAGGSP